MGGALLPVASPLFKQEIFMTIVKLFKKYPAVYEQLYRQALMPGKQKSGRPGSVVS